MGGASVLGGRSACYLRADCFPSSSPSLRSFRLPFSSPSLGSRRFRSSSPLLRPTFRFNSPSASLRYFRTYTKPSVLAWGPFYCYCLGPTDLGLSFALVISSAFSSVGVWMVTLRGCRFYCSCLPSAAPAALLPLFYYMTCSDSFLFYLTTLPILLYTSFSCFSIWATRSWSYSTCIRMRVPFL